MLLSRTVGLSVLVSNHSLSLLGKSLNLRLTDVHISTVIVLVLDSFGDAARFSRKLPLEVMPETRDHQHGRTECKCPRRKSPALNQVPDVKADAENGDDATDDEHCPRGPVKTCERLPVAKLQREQSEGC